MNRRAVRYLLAAAVLSAAIFAVVALTRPSQPSSAAQPDQNVKSTRQETVASSTTPVASSRSIPFTTPNPTSAASTALVSTSSRTGPPRGQPKTTPNRRNADQVATAFAEALNLWDTTTDARPGDVRRRAAAYAGPQLQTTLLHGPAPHLSSADLIRWNQLVVRRGWTSVTTQSGGLGDNPSDTATEASRAVTALNVDHAAGGWHYTSPSRPLYLLDLRRSGPGQPWSVAAYQVQDGNGS